ncbi:MAG: hypothetical protein ACYC2H_01305 [Thermoplasmatota archaeon]
MVDALNSRAEVVGHIRGASLTSVYTGSNAVTVTTTAPLAAGLYRVSAHAFVRTATAPIVNRSTFKVSIVWTVNAVENEQDVILTGVTAAGQELTLAQNRGYGGSVLVGIDAGTAIKFRVAYAINPTGPVPTPVLTYDLDVVLEALR